MNDLRRKNGEFKDYIDTVVVVYRFTQTDEHPTLEVPPPVYGRHQELDLNMPPC